MEREATLTRLREQLREDQERVRRREEELARLERALTTASAAGAASGATAADRQHELDLERYGGWASSVVAGWVDPWFPHPDLLGGRL